MSKEVFYGTTFCRQRRQERCLLGGLFDYLFIGLCWNGEHGGGHRLWHSRLWRAGPWSNRDGGFPGSLGSSDGDEKPHSWYPRACGGLQWMVWTKAFPVWKWGCAVQLKLHHHSSTTWWSVDPPRHVHHWCGEGADFVGIKTLTKLGSVIDVSGRWMVLSNVSPEVKIPLARSKAGHLLVNLTQDWLNLSRPLQPEPTEGAYMVRSLDLGVEATGHEVDTINNMNGFDIYHNNMHMSEKPLLTAVGARRHVGDVWMIDDEGDEGEGQHDEDDELAFLMAPDHSHQPLPSATQEMRDKILRQLSSPSLPTTSSAACHVTQEGHDRGKGQSSTEGDSPRHREYDWDRTIGPDPRDPRTVGAPCHGEHVIAPPGRGSKSGANRHARWESCEACGLRLSYTPTWGSHGATRQAGPLPQDTKDQITEKKPGKNSIDLVDKKISYDAQQRSLENQLKAVQQEGGVDENPNGQGRKDQGLQQAGAGQQVDRGREQVSGIFQSVGNGIRRDSSGPPREPVLPKDDSRGVGSLPEAAGGGDEPSAGQKSQKGRGVSREPGVQPKDSRAGRMDSHAQQPGQQVKMMQDGNNLGANYEVSLARNSTSNSSTTSMAFSSKAHVIDLTKGDSTGFTTSGILPTESTASTLPAKSSSGGKRKKDLDDKDVLVNMLTKEDTTFLAQELDKFNSEIDELFATLNVLTTDGRPPTVLELCCEEDSGLTRAIEQRGGRGIRCGLFNGCDLSKPSGFNKVKTLIEEEKPDAVWVALPCGLTSSIQELNMLTPEGLEKVQAKVAKSRKLAGRAVTLMELQVARGGEVVQEWPRYNKGWKFNCIQTFWNRHEHHEAYADGCAYGLCAPSGGAIKKPWRLRSTTRRIWKMQRLCQCQEPHVPCEGGDLTRRSALYPQRMCQQAAKMVEEIHGDLANSSFAVSDATDCDMDCLKAYTDQEVQTTAGEVLKLHRKLGHPSRQAFLKMLRDRGAGKLIRTLASIVHCPDCQEAAVPPARRAVTIEQATELWEVIQIDNMEITVGDHTYHFQIIIDEASGYGAANYLFKHDAAPGCSRNATTLECIEALYKGWIQYFGYPKMIKLDKEGAHRGRQLEEWAEGHGVEVQAVPAESHGQIGQVERLIGTLKRKMLAHLRSSDGSPEVAAWAMIGAHNTMSNVGGYSPCQWVFGRNFSDSMRLFDGHDLPYWSGMASSAKMQHQLLCRQEAEKHHREFVLREKTNLAYNTKMAKTVRYDPGALVYYKRYQPPADRNERSHQSLDVPRRRVARWYGPARVLATETKVSYDGAVRQPHNVAWIIASGRLKKVHTNQLRFASEREQLIAQGTLQLTLPWTFQDLASLINKGEFDDEIMTERQLRADAKKTKMDFEEQQRQQRSMAKRQLEETSPTGQEQASASTASRPRMETKPEDVPILEEDITLEDEEMDSRHQVQPGLEAERLLSDPDHFPMPPPDPAPLYRHPLFLQARRQHELSERPFHVQKREFLQRGTTETVDADMLVEDAVTDIFLAQVMHYAYAVTLPTPTSEAEWRSIVKDPSRFVAKKLAKGVEVSWQRLNNEQRAAMKEAKGIEIKEWLAARVCKAAVGEVPPDRLMRMRWVLVLKGTDDPKVVKAKARLVIVGFTDPDLGAEDVRSPTLSRRGRQCLLQLGTHPGWSTLKSDAKAAFLQTNDTQQKRNLWDACDRTAGGNGLTSRPCCSVSQGRLWTYSGTKRILSARGWHSARLQAVTPEGWSRHSGSQGEGRHHWQNRCLWCDWCTCGRLSDDWRWEEPAMVQLFGEVPWCAQVVTMGMRTYEPLWDLDGTRCPQHLASEPIWVLRRTQSSHWRWAGERLDCQRDAPVQSNFGRCTVEKLPDGASACCQAEPSPKPSTTWWSHHAQGHQQICARDLPPEGWEGVRVWPQGREWRGHHRRGLERRSFGEQGGPLIDGRICDWVCTPQDAGWCAGPCQPGELEHSQAPPCLQVKPGRRSPSFGRMRGRTFSCQSSLARTTRCWAGLGKPVEYHQENSWCAGGWRKGALRHAATAGHAEPVVEREAHCAGSHGFIPALGGAGDGLAMVQLRPAVVWWHDKDLCGWENFQICPKWTEMEFAFRWKLYSGKEIETHQDGGRFARSRCEGSDMVGFDSWNFGACQNFSYSDVKFPSWTKHVSLQKHVSIFHACQKHGFIIIHVNPTCQVRHIACTETLVACPTATGYPLANCGTCLRVPLERPADYFAAIGGKTRLRVACCFGTWKSRSVTSFA